MEAPQHIPVSQKAPELTTQAPPNSSASKRVHRGRSLALHMAIRPYHWFQDNTFAPDFLTGAAAHPALGYVVAFLLQLVMCIAVLVLVHFYPGFRFQALPLILVILLVALGWGAGPSIVALLIGAVLLIL